MSVSITALISLDEALRYLGKDPTRAALSVYYDGANATATIEVTDRKVICTDGSVHSFNLKDGSYDMLQGLINAINALADWTAALLWEEDAISDNLLMVESADCKTSANTQTLYLHETLDSQTIWQYEQFINQATGWFERITRRKLKSRDYLFERYAGSGAELFVKNYPITKIESIGIGSIDCIKVENTNCNYNAAVKVSATGATLVEEGSEGTEIAFADFATMTLLAAEINSTAGWTAEVSTSTEGAYPSDRLYKHPSYYCLNDETWLKCPYLPLYSYEIDMERGIIDLGSDFSTTFRGVFLCYTGGYITIPDELKLIACGLVKGLESNRKTDGTMKSEKMGDYSYTRSEIASLISEDDMKVLYSYRRVIV